MNRKLTTVPIVLAITAIIIAAIGCSESTDSNDDNNTETRQIVPLAIGNMWVYTSSGVEEGTPYQRSDTLEVLDDTTVNGETWYKASFHTSGAGDAFLLTNRSDGLWQWYIYSGKNQEMLAKYPAITNDAWTLLDGSSKVIVNVDTLVSSGPGPFRTVHYENHRDAVEADEYFCANVGLILRKEVQVDQSNSEDTVYTDQTLLSSYSLK